MLPSVTSVMCHTEMRKSELAAKYQLPLRDLRFSTLTSILVRENCIVLRLQVSPMCCISYVDMRVLLVLQTWYTVYMGIVGISKYG